MPSDEHNLTTAKATGLIFLVLNIASACNRCLLAYCVQCTHHGLIFVYHHFPLIVSGVDSR